MKKLFLLAAFIGFNSQAFAQEEWIELPESAFQNGSTLTQALIKNADSLKTNGDCETLSAKEILSDTFRKNGIFSMNVLKRVELGKVVYGVIKTTYISADEFEATSYLISTDLDGRVVNNTITCTLAM